MAVWMLFGTVFGYAACIQSTSQSYSSSSANATGTGSTGTAMVAFDKRALLSSLANLALGEIDGFATQTEALLVATESLQKAPTPEHLDSAREAFRSATKTWQRLEMMQFGPAAASALPGGRGLRDEIYAWPAVNRCAVDQLLANGQYAEPAMFSNTLINVRGLGALEHLLFDTEVTNACSSANALNTSGAWSAVTAELPQRRADYALATAKLVNERAHALRDAWAPAEGNFASELTTPGASYAGELSQALDAVAYAFHYLDTKTKDLKLAVPAGLSGCPSPNCPERLELAEAKLSKAAIRENIVAYQRLFHGGAPFDDAALGFDDWLYALGANDLRFELGSAIAACLAAVDAIEEEDLAEALANDPKSVEAAYFAVKKTTDLMKTQFVSVLGLHLPSGAPTDND